MTSREAPAGPAGRIDHVDEGMSFEGNLFCTGGRSEGPGSPGRGACVPPQGDAGRRTRENAAHGSAAWTRPRGRSRRRAANRPGNPCGPRATRRGGTPARMRRDCAGRAVRGKYVRPTAGRLRGTCASAARRTRTAVTAERAGELSPARLLLPRSRRNLRKKPTESLRVTERVTSGDWPSHLG